VEVRGLGGEAGGLDVVEGLWGVGGGLEVMGGLGLVGGLGVAVGGLTHWGRGHLNCLNARSRGF